MKYEALNQPLLVKGTFESPRINFNAKEGYILIEGRTLMEDATLFWEPIFEWLEAYAQSPCTKTVVDLKIEYFNSSSSKIFLNLFYLLKSIRDDNHEVIINWMSYEEDEDMQDTGEAYSKILNIPFNFVPYY